MTPPPSNHFDNPAAARQDTMLQLCIQQGYVPAGCVLAGQIVFGLMQKGEDPCWGCRGPRHQCGGRPFGGEIAKRGDIRERRLKIGTAQSIPRDGSYRFFFEGVDPAPSESHKSDEGALVVGCATPRSLANIQHPTSKIQHPMADLELSQNEADWNFDYVFARRMTSLQRASARQWAAVIHEHHQWFGLEKILMDPGGGGLFVQRELKAPKQFINGREVEVTPIADQDTGPQDVVKGYFILHLFKRGDPGIERLWPGLAGDDLLNDAAYSEMKSALDHCSVAFPPKPEDVPKEELVLWTPERLEVLRTLNRTIEQFKGLTVAMDPTNPERFLFTRRNARQFSATGKKDLMSAAMYAYLAFRIWLASDDWKSNIKPQNRRMGRMR